MMRKILNYITFLVLLIASIDSFTKDTYVASHIFSQMENRVFRIKAAFGEDSPKASYGSGFALARNGLVVTNYHVIATSLKRHEKYKIFVEIEEKSYEASILAIDVINDLALLKIDRVFHHIIRIRDDEMKVGDRIFSLGIPQDLGMSIVEGIYNGVKKNGVYENIHMSSPLNAGMSGGPVVDSRGRLVGVNVAVLFRSQNISFAVTNKSVNKLLKRYYKEKKKKKVDLIKDGIDEVNKEIQSQLLVAQQSLVDDFLSSSKEEKTEGPWKYSKTAKELKCWQVDVSDKKKNLYSMKTEVCYVPNSSYVMSGVYSGTYELKFSMMSTERLNTLKFYNYVDSVYNSSQKIESFFINYTQNQNFTKYRCDEAVVVNSSQIPFQVNYCLRGYIEYQEVFDLNIKAVTLLREKDAFLVEANLRGFTQNNINVFLRALLSGVGYIDNDDN